jgi:hypothetical protein
MIAQAIKKAPRANVEPFPRKTINPIFTIVKKSENINELPAWAVERITRIARERIETQGETLQEALYSLENEALIVLLGDITTFPELAMLIPANFSNRLKNSRSTLTDFERGIAILLNEDAKKCLPAIDVDLYMDEFIHLKWEALGGLLAGGLHD